MGSAPSTPTKRDCRKIAVSSIAQENSSAPIEAKICPSVSSEVDGTMTSDLSQPHASIQRHLSSLSSCDSIEGEFEGHLAFTDGTHKWKFSNGDIYYGEWKNGMMHGKGTLNVVNQKAVYEGAFEHNEFHGKGIFVYSNGNIFKGTFKNGYRQGRGHMDFADGSSMKGVWANGRKVEGLTGRLLHSFSSVAPPPSPESSPGGNRFDL